MDIPIPKAKASILTSNKLLLSSILVLLTLAFISYKFFDPAPPAVEESKLWISQVKQGEFIRQVRGVGVLAPSEIRWIAADSAGRVERIYVKPGAIVSQDTIIAELSNPQLRSQLEQARWDLDAAEANLLALKAQIQEQKLEQELLIRQAEMNLESAKLKEIAEQQLADKNIISKLQFASTQLATKQNQTLLDIRAKSQLQRTELSRAKLVAEEAQIRKYRNLVQRFQSQSDDLQIKAGIEGVLQEVSVEVGQRIDIGGNIAKVARPDSLLAELQVQENMVQELQIGFSVSIDTRNGVIDGIVSRIDPRVNNGNVQVDVSLIGELPKGARPDLSITGNIIVEKIANTLYIDRPVGVSSSMSIKLFTLIEDSERAYAKNIELGKASVSRIQVVNGLELGERVVVSDMTEFQQYPAIRIIQ